jgi:hypothetical protein
VILVILINIDFDRFIKPIIHLFTNLTIFTFRVFTHLTIFSHIWPFCNFKAKSINVLFFYLFNHFLSIWPEKITYSGDISFLKIAKYSVWKNELAPFYDCRIGLSQSVDKNQQVLFYVNVYLNFKHTIFLSFYKQCSILTVIAEITY